MKEPSVLQIPEVKHQLTLRILTCPAMSVIRILICTMFTVLQERLSTYNVSYVFFLQMGAE